MLFGRELGFIKVCVCVCGGGGGDNDTAVRALDTAVRALAYHQSGLTPCDIHVG